jgi:hypothetical protein
MSVSAFGVEDSRLSKADEGPNKRRRRNIVAGTAAAGTVAAGTQAARDYRTAVRVTRRAEDYNGKARAASRAGDYRRAHLNALTGQRLVERTVKPAVRGAGLGLGSLVLGGATLGALATGPGKKKKQPS